MKYFLYIIELSDGSFYTGITNNIEKRLKKHSSGKGSKYVRSRLPIQKVIILEHLENKSIALKRELEIKKLTRKEKEELIKQGVAAVW